MDGTRGATAMSARKFRRPARALPPPLSTAAFTAAGLAAVIARGQRVDQVGQHEADALGVGFVQAGLATTPSAVCAAAR